MRIIELIQGVHNWNEYGIEHHPFRSENPKRSKPHRDKNTLKPQRCKILKITTTLLRWDVLWHHIRYQKRTKCHSTSQWVLDNEQKRAYYPEDTKTTKTCVDHSLREREWPHFHGMEIETTSRKTFKVLQHIPVGSWQQTEERTLSTRDKSPPAWIIVCENKGDPISMEMGSKQRRQLRGIHDVPGVRENSPNWAHFRTVCCTWLRNPQEFWGIMWSKMVPYSSTSLHNIVVVVEMVEMGVLHLLAITENGFGKDLDGTLVVLWLTNCVF